MDEASRDTLKLLWKAALEAVDPRRCVHAALDRPALDRVLRGGRGRVGVFSVGKAAAGMYAAAAPLLRGVEGLVVLPDGYPSPAADAEVLFASHPEPDRSSVAAAKRAVAYFREFSRCDVVVCLVSGGTSSLLCLPRPGIGLAEKVSRVRRLARSGASIGELNRLRTSLSAVKGGRLGRTAARGVRLVTLVLSDVPGDDPALVGSGPTVRGREGDVVRVVGSNASGLTAAARAATDCGLAPVRSRRRFEGNAAEEGRALAQRALTLRPGEVLLAGGETTVSLGVGRVGHRGGRGGRGLELALAASERLAGSDVVLLAAASDGLDGSSGAAGAFADGTTIRRARGLGLRPASALARHDTAPFFDALGDLFVTGPTGTNVCDWVFAVREPAAPV
jgi:glycerate 2-kinase